MNISFLFAIISFHFSHASPSNSSSATYTPPKQGWTSQPSGRGTLDIIWSCGFTMCLCSWSILCLNVPGPGDTPFRMFRRKLYVTGLAFLGPEFVFQISLGQWLSACSSVRQFKASGYSQWTMSHAFFADMGGLVLHTKDWTPFPIDAKQLHYLVMEGYVAFPSFDKKKISDKNKVDGLLRLLTLLQILWFVINMAGRFAQGLDNTCGELTTAAFIVCSTGTMFCWNHKPADVATAEKIKTEATMAEILLNAGDAARTPYSRTPLDFVSRKEWSWSLYWSNWINIIRHLGIIFGPQTRPVNRFENTISLELPGNTRWIFAAMANVYSGIFVCGWNYGFPTRTELMLWRAATATMLATAIGYFAITESAFELYPALQRKLYPKEQDPKDPEKGIEAEASIQRGWISTKAKRIAACVRNNSVSQDPALNVPLKAIVPMYIIGVFYCFARTYIFIADIIQLRSLPPSAYVTVEWMEFIPHF